MKLPKEVAERVMAKFGRVVDLQAHPEILDALADELTAMAQQGSRQGAAPFGISWMDSWVAHWIYSDNIRKAEERGDELASVLRSLADVKFNERIGEIHGYIHGLRAAPPDGGTPEPGIPSPPPPPAPAPFAPPDGGTPEPGIPSPPPPPGPAPFASPDGGTPKPGVPEPKARETLGSFGENPWILYWFISVKAPMLLEVIDLHLTRRLQELGGKFRS